MKKLSNKGFTLIELLATILIIGLVLGLTTYGIVSSVDKAKTTSTTISVNGIKEAARTYSSEYTDDTWKVSNTSNNIYFCTTIQELINKGLLDKNAKNVEDNKISLNDYIAVIKDKTTKVIKKEEILNLDTTENEAYQYCTGNTKPEDTKKIPTIDSNQTYTDTIEITKFTDAEFKTKDGNVTGIKEKRYEYGLSSSNFTEKGTITNQECTIEGLKQNETYYVRICMTSEYGTDACSRPKSITTKQIVSPKIELNKNTTNSIKITYDDSNIKGAKFHYFKSSIDATSDKNVSTCKKGIEDFNCESNSNKSIAAGTWYKVTDKEVVLTYSEEGDFNQITVTAETRDKSNNSSGEISKTFNRLITTFSKGNADRIGDGTSDIKESCLVDVGKSCSITSPTIEKAEYIILGWNTNSNATASTWNVGTSKNISKSETYYPIVSLKQYKISYEANGGTGTMSDHTALYGKNITIKANTFTKKGYTFIGWTTKSDGTDDGYNWTNWSGKWEFKNGQYGIANDQLVLYAIWRINVVNIKFSTYGGKIDPDAPGKVYNWQENNFIISKNNSEVFFTINYGESIYEHHKSGLPNYNNGNYLKIIKKGYTAVSNAEWICASSNCNIEGGKYSQSSTKYSASDFCDASNGDCTVVLGVNWRVNKINIKYNVNGGTLNTKNKAYGTSGSYVTLNGSTIVETYDYGTKLGENGLSNYNNDSYIYIEKTEHRAVPTEEWACSEGNCKRETYDQLLAYNTSELCDASNGDCTIVLKVNWERYKEINDYRCLLENNEKKQKGPRYYITNCIGELCYYTRVDCKPESGHREWRKMATCLQEDITECRYDTFNKKKYDSLSCVGGYCCTGTNCTNYSIDRCYLNDECKVEPATYKVTFHANGRTFIKTNSGKFTNNNQTWTGGGFVEGKNYNFKDFAPSFESTFSSCTFAGWKSSLDGEIYYNYFTINGKDQEFTAQWYCPASTGPSTEPSVGYCRTCSKTSQCYPTPKIGYTMECYNHRCTPKFVATNEYQDCEVPV